MIEVEGLTKHYGKVAALCDVTFHVARGTVVGFLGPNGAGKSTTLRLLAGFLGATSGSAKIAGFDIQASPIEARRCLGYMPESSPLYPEMRVREYLRFRAELKGVPRRERKKAVDRALSLANVQEVADVVILHLSKGFRQRVGLADALLADPPLLILDEPTAGLDPNQVRQVRALITQLAENHTILLSTHILSEVEATCHRAIVIHRGRKVAEGSLEELRALRQPGGLRLMVRVSPDVLERALKESPDLDRWEYDLVGNRDSMGRQTTDGDRESSSGPTLGSCNEKALVRLRLHWKPGVDVPFATESTFRRLASIDAGVQHAEPLVASLDDVFSSLTVDPTASMPQEEP